MRAHDVLDEREHARLAEVLDVLLPGDAERPAASALGLVDEVVALAARREDDTAAVRALLGEVDSGASASAPSWPSAAALSRAEQAVPEAVRAVLQLACCAYYAHPTVRDVLARTHGYPPRPPQPLGYELGAG
jgi:hypothetical protein